MRTLELADNEKKNWFSVHFSLKRGRFCLVPLTECVAELEGNVAPLFSLHEESVCLLLN